MLKAGILIAHRPCLDYVPFTYGSGVAEELGKFRESREVAAEVIISVTMGTLPHRVSGVNWSDSMIGEATIRRRRGVFRTCFCPGGVVGGLLFQ